MIDETNPAAPESSPAPDSGAGFSGENKTAKTIVTTGDELGGIIVKEMSAPTRAGKHVKKDEDGFFTLESEEAEKEEKPLDKSLSKVRLPIKRPENVSEKGEKFDPEIHATDADGKPIKKENGEFAKKRGRKSASIVRDPRKGKEKADTKPAPVPYDPKNPDMFDASAGTWLDMGTQIAAGLTGNDELLFENEGERESLRVPLAAVLRERGTAEMTPSQMFVCALAMFAFSRIGKPKTQAMFNKWFGEKEPEKKKELDTEKPATPETGGNPQPLS